MLPAQTADKASNLLVNILEHLADEEPQELVETNNERSDHSLQGHVAGSRIFLRDTTLLPDIPGLPAFITMLFTPIMELR